MKKELKKIIISFLLVITIGGTCLPSKAHATIASCTYSTGNIKYHFSTANIGSYSSILTSAVNTWNNAIQSYGYSNDVSLSSNNPAEVIGSFISSYDNTYCYGRCSIWARDIYGDLYTPDITDSAIWEFAFLYVYPSHVAIGTQVRYPQYSNDFNECLIRTTLHEFGHILGLMHPIDETDTIMTPALTNDTAPFPYDLADIYDQWCS